MVIEQSRPLAFFDLETTGLDLLNDRIIQIAIIKQFPDGSQEILEHLINPFIESNEEAFEIHRISSEELKDAPPFSELANEIHAFLDDADWVGYNLLRFDIPMLVEAFHRENMCISLDRKIIDAFRIFKIKESRTLRKAMQFYCDETFEAHSAMADTIATRKVLLSQVQHYDDMANSVESLDDEFTPAYYKNDFDWSGFLNCEDDRVVFLRGPYKGKMLGEIFKQDPDYIKKILNYTISSKAKDYIRKILQ
ncbi:MAG: 3'-5' exonuclease [Lentisphaeria bacterium]|nr:3'-5' exonuclease [Lentisphaeria bacterium]